MTVRLFIYLYLYVYFQYNASLKRDARESGLVNVAPVPARPQMVVEQVRSGALRPYTSRQSQPDGKQSDSMETELFDPELMTAGAYDLYTAAEPPPSLNFFDVYRFVIE